MSLLRSLESPQHARLRFCSTVVMSSKNIPVWVETVNDDWSVRAFVLGTDTRVPVSDIRSGDLLPDPVKLGFCQIGSEAFYLSRRPSRRSKQGLDLSDVSIFHTLGGNIDLITTTAFKAVAKTITGDFCSFEAAIESVKEKKPKSLAFHRDWALVNKGGDIQAFYKFYGICGILEKDKIRLSNRFEYLKETLEEDVGNVCA